MSESSMDGDRHIDEINVSSGDEGVPNVQPSNVDSQKKKRKRGTNVRQGVKIYRSKSNPNKTRHLKAGCWDHFDPFTDSEDGAFKGRCIYCKAIYHADTSKNGTSNLNRHMVKCANNPNNVPSKQSKICLTKTGGDGESASVSKWEYNQDRIWRAVLNLFVLAELPFSLIRHPAMIELVESLSPIYKLPSRWTASKGVSKYFVEERMKLLNFLSKTTQGVHLTTDTWTSSNQRKNYMVLTAHFIDDDWVLNKKIINFKCIHSHRGDDIGWEILDCITEWQLKNVMTMSVDNATSNDKAVKYLIDRLPNLYDDGKHFQIRCMAHILNLIVKDGLSIYDTSIEGVRSAVRYIKNSTQRIDSFKECILEAKCESKRFLCQDCPTRWNSTLDMLKTALELKDAFVKYERNNTSYIRDLQYVFSRSDWLVIESFVNFFEKFKEKTELVSGTSYPVAHRFFMEVLDIDEHLREWEKKVTYGDMVGKMREKFKKYWGDFSKLNMYMYFALILDPCMKMTSIEYGFKILMSYDRKPEILDDEFEGMVAEKAGVVEKAFGVLFAKYKATYDSLGESSQKPSNKSSNEVASSQSRNSVVNAFLFGRGGGSYKVATELDKYLSEPREELHTGFDILLWWKLNGPRFPILSRMAKDILAIQVSTVASESAFSTGGRVLDPYRTRLSTSLVEALICLQDWVKNKMMVNMDDEVVDLEKDEDVVRDMEEEVRKMTITS